LGKSLRAVDPKVSPGRRAANYRRGKTDGRTSEVSANKTVGAREIRASFRRIGCVSHARGSRVRWVDGNAL